MWELDYKESWALKSWCFWTVVLEKTLESPLDCKEIQPVHPKGDQSWVFIGMTDVEAETPILWLPDAESWLIWKDPDAGKDWGQEEKGTTENEMVGWHYGHNGHGFGWTLGVGDGQGSLACCSSWDHKESDTTEQLNWTEPIWWAQSWEHCRQVCAEARITERAPDSLLHPSLCSSKGQGERKEEFFGKKDKVIQNLEVRHKGNFCGFQAGSSPPDWVARGMVGVPQTLPSEMHTSQE